MRTLPIGDERVGASSTGDEIVVRSPFDGHEIDRVPACGEEEVRRAVALATTARRENTLAPWERAEILDRAAHLLAQRTEEFARIIAEEAAKPIKTARVEAMRAVSTFTFASVEARRLAGEMVPLDASDVGAGKLGFTLRLPIGVVGAISPFNFPLNLVAHKVAPAIAAGCPVVLKPASQTPLSAIALAELLLDECGLPSGHLSVVTGSGGSVGNAIVDDPDIALITFTGSPEVGWGIKSRAPHKKVGLELGNNAPVIIEPDGDVSTAAAKIAVAGFSHAGQSCISTQRVYLHESIADAFLDEMVPKVDALVVGDPLDEKTDVSALISASESDRVADWIEEARAGGANIVTGGDRTAEGLLRPTVITGARPAMKV
jgi:acyl-CoA reductase-like NAD-dependent aldehyde dehydrogenase